MAAVVLDGEGEGAADAGQLAGAGARHHVVAQLLVAVAHDAELLGVLPDGPELDAERERVEVVLVGAGMVLVDTF